MLRSGRRFQLQVHELACAFGQLAESLFGLTRKEQAHGIDHGGLLFHAAIVAVLGAVQQLLVQFEERRLVFQIVIKGCAQRIPFDQVVHHLFLIGNGLEPLLNLLLKAINFLQRASGGNTCLMAAQAVVFGAHGGCVVHTGQRHLGHRRACRMNLRQLQPGHQPQQGREKHHQQKADAQLGAYAPV